MAIKDVKQYYYNMECQYLEMKNDLADYEQAFKDGYISQDQLDGVKEDIAGIEQNYQRLTYILFLLEQPSRSQKKKKRNNKAYNTYFENNGSDMNSVIKENTDTLASLRKELKKLTSK